MCIYYIYNKEWNAIEKHPFRWGKAAFECPSFPMAEELPQHQSGNSKNQKETYTIVQRSCPVLNERDNFQMNIFKNKRRLDKKQKQNNRFQRRSYEIIRWFRKNKDESMHFKDDFWKTKTITLKTKTIRHISKTIVDDSKTIG